ncbi:MAG: hypothetical protein WEA61_10495 [Anaerolineales bacterium]
MKSTSIHRLNADHRLSKWKRRIWFALNWLNNSIFPGWKSNTLEIRHFDPDLSGKAWQQVDSRSSPSRALSDLFWMQLPWERIHADLGQIHIVDTGCGSGRYGEELQKFSGGRTASYTGLDESAHPDWAERVQRNAFIHLQVADSAGFGDMIPPITNLFMSQSAIEHFPEDLTYFRQVKHFIDQQSGPVLQIHLFPSAACLRLYRFHGVRQYTPRTVSMICALFPESACHLFELGGSDCNELHWEYVTKPVLLEGRRDRRETEAEPYAQRLRQALEAQSSGRSDASFYALVIHSHAKNRII